MIKLNNQAELEALLLHFDSFIKDNPKLKAIIKSNFKVVEDQDFEKRLDDLQNELAELEEIKDDLTVKLCFLRKDLCLELQNKIKKDVVECKIDFETFSEKEVQKDKIQESTKTSFDFTKTKLELEKTKKLLNEEMSKKITTSFDVYRSAEMYFDTL